MYNAAKVYSLQLAQGEGYRDLRPVIALIITDFVMFSEHNQVISHFEFREKNSQISYVEDHLELVFVELPKFEKELEELETLNELEELGKRELFIHDQQGVMIFAKKEGRKEGRKEAKKEIACQLLPLLDDQTISQTTGLSIEEIEKLRESLT